MGADRAMGQGEICASPSTEMVAGALGAGEVAQRRGVEGEEQRGQARALGIPQTMGQGGGGDTEQPERQEGTRRGQRRPSRVGRGRGAGEGDGQGLAQQGG